VCLAQADREPDDPPPIVGAEAAVVVARRLLGFVFLPQQVERDALAPQFAVDGRPIGFGTTLARGRYRRVELRLQPPLAHACRQRPYHADELGSTEDLADRRRRTLDHSSDLAMAEATLLGQP
jgi:hypothetical protein